MPAPDTPAALLPRRHAGGAQSDTTMAHTIRRAHAFGMDVLLKPQISGEVGWPGSIDMPSGAAWNRFFDRYADWMLHYALTAERYDVEVLCIGTELVEVTRNHEEEWRRLIERVRAAYDGAVVYAANWGDEAERLSFGDALDAVGIDSYYPLTSDTSATDAALRAGAETVADRIQAVADRTGRPVLLTEMGFSNTEARGPPRTKSGRTSRSAPPIRRGPRGPSPRFCLRLCPRSGSCPPDGRAPSLCSLMCAFVPSSLPQSATMAVSVDESDWGAGADAHRDGWVVALVGGGPPVPHRPGRECTSCSGRGPHRCGTRYGRGVSRSGRSRGSFSPTPTTRPSV